MQKKPKYIWIRTPLLRMEKNNTEKKRKGCPADNFHCWKWCMMRTGWACNFPAGAEQTTLIHFSISVIPKAPFVNFLHISPLDMDNTAARTFDLVCSTCFSRSQVSYSKPVHDYNKEFNGLFFLGGRGDEMWIWVCTKYA